MFQDHVAVLTMLQVPCLQRLVPVNVMLLMFQAPDTSTVPTETDILIFVVFQTDTLDASNVPDPCYKYYVSRLTQ